MVIVVVKVLSISSSVVSSVALVVVSNIVRSIKVVVVEVSSNKGSIRF